VRVIGGDAKGRRLVAPDLPGVRPTSDRVREAMFDILEARELVEDARVVDLFAGTGALGIEALSRGARSVTFIEHDRRAVAAIERNLELAGYSGHGGVRLVRSEVESWAALHGREPADVVLADPPYEFDQWGWLFESLAAPTLLVEHRGRLEIRGQYEISREYRYGGTLVTLVQSRPDGPASALDPLEPATNNEDSA